jgi:predicted Mrr-cat superfamily restriction endonuclease
MPSKPMWKIAAGGSGTDFELFHEGAFVAMGLDEIGDLSSLKSRKPIAERIKRKYPSWPMGRVSAWGGMLYRFQHEVAVGDHVITYNPRRRVYLVGTITSECQYDTTRVSPMGPDRGKDIIASPDGFGFESPRIVVEVKHRSQAMGSQEIRSFLGGRHVADKGLYVSTGGFTKDAYYEAERANIPLTLMSLDELVKALLDYYDQLDIETQQLVPLKKIYWPV